MVASVKTEKIQVAIWRPELHSVLLVWCGTVYAAVAESASCRSSPLLELIARRYSTAQYSRLSAGVYSTISAAQRIKVQYSTYIQYSAVQHSTVHTVQYSTAQ